MKWWKLLQEFLCLKQYYSARLLPKIVDIVWVLSGPEYEVSGENRRRLETGLRLATKLKAKQFIYNGVTLQNKHLAIFLQKIKLPRGLSIKVFPCSQTNRGSTWLQFQTLIRQKLIKANDVVVIVSSWYHLPRVNRLAEKLLIKRQSYFLTGPEDESVNWLKYGLDLVKLLALV